MRKILLLVMIHELLRPVRSVNGVIWDKKLQDFVPIFSIPAFAAVNNELLSQSRGEEIYDFQGRIVRFSYYEEKNLINSIGNGTRITGIIGEIWNILSEYLNFTIKPILTNEKSTGASDPDGIFRTGLLKYIADNETDVISRMEAHSKRLTITQMTMPLWKAEYRLYIEREVRHVPTWMVKLFSKRVWQAVLITYLLLSMCSYLSHKVETKIMLKKLQTGLNDHFFYNFGMICGQSFFPSSSTRSSRIIELWLGLFSCLIRTAFSALLIGYMTQTTFTPPFKDIESLLDNTSYKILTLNGSIPNIIIERGTSPTYKKVLDMKRYVVMNTIEEMYTKICTSNNPYTIFESEDLKKARGMYFCRLNPVGIPLFYSWIVPGISKTFTHRRSIDIGMLKLYEVGFIKLLKHRWIESKNVEKESLNVTEPIILEQVYLTLMIFIGGLLISFIILLFENIIFYCKIKKIS
ncbi:uncharacterized protein LOC126873757 [Bombus huntii]|uniref:uncharacterized protein LOC126873757 n=1 Tax=Bombus huntii TaxID=85661 RepID=UPI0021A9EF14|nr:uncharacterized protein LOC126873757 [Bombus huntii]